MINLSILPFNAITFSEEIYHKENPIPLEIFRKTDAHQRYFAEYLNQDKLHACFMLIEPHYVQREWLSDMKSYYVTCFNPIPQHTKRIHFFTAPNVSIETFEKRLKDAILYDNDTIKDFWDKQYLGWMVVKPLPVMNIGLTVLRHYNYLEDGKLYNKERKYWGIKEYSATIFGKHVTIKNALSWQEQENNLSACASVAIATMLQVPSEQIGFPSKTPGEITEQAGLSRQNGERVIPNSGLSLEDMGEAIKENGLETEIYKLRDKEIVQLDGSTKFISRDDASLTLKKLVKAYSPLKIPILLGVMVPDDYVGHAVTICGHRERKELPTASYLTMRWQAEKIYKLYVMDDGLGPYSRMSFEDKKTNIPYANGELSSGWSREKNVLLDSAIIGVYPKIRISFGMIEGISWQLNSPAKELITNQLLWNIEIRYGSNYKTNFIERYKEKKSDAYETFKLRFLQESLPKYIWIISLFVENDNDSKVDFLFDATGMRHSRIGLTIVYHDFELCERFKKSFARTSQEELAKKPHIERIPYVRYWHERMTTTNPTSALYHVVPNE